MELYNVLAGSRLYGTNRPDSDYDYRVVRIEPIESLIGLQAPFEVKQYQDNGEDVAHYGLRKFCNLALSANPNILELLFAPKEAIQFINSDFEEIRAIRFHFLSQKIRKTFGGYAKSQIIQISQKDYQPVGAKAAIIAKHGWDTKAGMHLFRLCYQGYELLTNSNNYSPMLGGFALKEALTILNGQRSKEQVLTNCEALLKDLDNAHSLLPEEPDYRTVEHHVMRLLKAVISKYDISEL